MRFVLFFCFLVGSSAVTCNGWACLKSVNWSDEPGFLQEKVFSSREPLRILDSPSKSWTALKKWTPEYLRKAMPHHLTAVCNSDQNTFYYFEESGLHQIYPDTWKAPAQCSPMLSSEFMDKMEASPNTQGDHYYFSKKVNDLSVILMNDLDDLVKLAPELRGLDPEDAEELDPIDKMDIKATNLWVGGAGTVARAHFDASHNLFVQVKGSKRFVLSPPSQWASNYMFSRLHPCNRACGVDFSLDDANATQAGFELFGEPANHRVEVEVQAGEMLYIPPFYFHQVISASDQFSVSINIYHHATEKDVLKDIFSVSLPIDAVEVEGETKLQRSEEANVAAAGSEQEEKAIASLAHSLYYLVEGFYHKHDGAHGYTEVAHFLKKVSQSRHTHLQQDKDGLFPGLRAMEQQRREHRKKLGLPSFDVLCAHMNKHAFTAKFKSLLDRLLDLIHKLPVDIQELILADVVEVLIYRVVGNRLLAFTEECFPVQAQEGTHTEL